MAAETASKTCFVISPIGSVGSDTRRRADCCLHYIIRPAFKELGFETPVRIDEKDSPGQITHHIVQQIVDADWCVADLTGNNANVFYELGIRHAFRKPVIHLATDVGSVPFDNRQQNTIEYTHDDPSSHRQAIERIIQQVRAVETSREEVTTPVSMALGLKKLAEQGDTEGQLLSMLLTRVEEIEARQRAEAAARQAVQGKVWSYTGGSNGNMLRDISLDPDMSEQDRKRIDHLISKRIYFVPEEKPE